MINYFVKKITLSDCGDSSTESILADLTPKVKGKLFFKNFHIDKAE